MIWDGRAIVEERLSVRGTRSARWPATTTLCLTP